VKGHIILALGLCCSLMCFRVVIRLTVVHCDVRLLMHFVSGTTVERAILWYVKERVITTLILVVSCFCLYDFSCKYVRLFWCHRAACNFNLIPYIPSWLLVPSCSVISTHYKMAGCEFLTFHSTCSLLVSLYVCFFVYNLFNGLVGSSC
jgi:hypothetical protein